MGLDGGRSAPKKFYNFKRPSSRCALDPRDGHNLTQSDAPRLQSQSGGQTSTLQASRH